MPFQAIRTSILNENSMLFGYLRLCGQNRQSPREESVTPSDQIC